MKLLYTCVILMVCMLNVYSVSAQVQDSTSVRSSPQRNSVYNIFGKVIDSVDGEGVPFATVFFPNTSVGTITDDYGNYHLQFNTIPGDSIEVQVMSYERAIVGVNFTHKTDTVNIFLTKSASYLNEVVVTAGVDPAVIFMRKVIKNKPLNNSEQKINNYACEAYNKIEVDLINFSRQTFERLPVPYLKKLGFIYENTDSTSYDKPFLPVYLTEAVSDYYYQKSPRKTKEYIKATQMKAIKNKNMTNSVSQYLGKIYLAINPYDNYLPFFDKEFVSPLSNTALAFYKYTLLDTQRVNGYNIITVGFRPQRKGEQCFTGELKIADSVYALKYIEAELPKGDDINWVKKSDFYKEYELLGDSIWFCTRENITAELQVTDELMKTPGFIIRKTTLYDSIRVNILGVQKTVSSDSFGKDVIVAENATERTEEYWRMARHEKLNENEQGVYDMYDSLERDPYYKRLKTLIKIFATGGYKFGPIELGPYWSMYSYNQIEQNRFQFNIGTTPKLFENIYMNGYVAYGTGDNRYKYSIQSFFLLNRNPRRYFNFSYKHDIDYTVNYYDRVSINNIFSLAIRKNGIPLKFMFADDVRFELYNESQTGFSQLLTLYRKVYDPYDPLPSTTIFQQGDSGVPSETVTASEVSLKLRFAYKEKFVNGNYLRYSLGSKYPIVDVRLALGIKGLFDADYNYQRITMTVSDNWRIPPLGQLYVNVFAGKYFGTLPYPLLEQHPGNEFYYYNKYAFNMMNQYEFVSDQYLGINLEHSLGGGLFKYIPLVRKLKLRQFWTAKGLIGSLSDENVAYNFNKGFTFRSLNNTPYLEVGTGIENIFKLFRIDFVWRVNPQSLPDEPVERDFGIFGSMKLAF